MFTKLKLARQQNQEEGFGAIETLMLIAIIAILFIIGANSFVAITQKVAEKDGRKQIIEQTKESAPVFDPIQVLPGSLTFAMIIAGFVLVITVCYLLWNRHSSPKPGSPKKQAYNAGLAGEYYNHEDYSGGIIPRKPSTLRTIYLEGVADRAFQNSQDHELGEQLIKTEMYKNNDMEAIEFYLTHVCSRIR